MGTPTEREGVFIVVIEEGMFWGTDKGGVIVQS